MYNSYISRCRKREYISGLGLEKLRQTTIITRLREVVRQLESGSILDGELSQSQPQSPEALSLEALSPDL